MATMEFPAAIFEFENPAQNIFIGSEKDVIDFTVTSTYVIIKYSNGISKGFFIEEELFKENSKSKQSFKFSIKNCDSAKITIIAYLKQDISKIICYPC